MVHSTTSLFRLIAMATVGSFAVAAAFAAEQPNIVVIITDDQGYADFSYNPHHGEEVSTPHMDALAREGVYFSQGYTTGPVCSPTRAGLMLGRYQQRVGIYTAGDGGSGFDPDIKIFPGFLPNTYRSMAIGKWHLGLDNDYPELKWHAVSRGFDEAYKFMGRGAHDYFKLTGIKGDYSPIYRNKRRIEETEYEGYLTTRLSEEAVSFIDRQKDSPFFLYLAYNAVHTPAQAPQEDIDRYRAKYPHLTETRAILLAMLEHLDDGVGAVVNKLKEEEIWDNTLLFFLTDNGGASAMDADNGHLRDFKQTLYEGGIRTPFIVSWPDRFQGQRVIDTPISSFDILPTVVDALEIDAPEVEHFDGKSLLPLISGENKTHHDVMFWDSGEMNRGWAVRHGDWKLKVTKKGPELFNLWQDPSEKLNVADDHPAITQSLEKRYQEWRAELPEPGK
ncbi:sulfatase-like hydrolase/transferase [Opitutaceae bacterium]|jgi:arylsulfatase A-like enzyme|nr:sulfatase-like hydrolase/transferase [Opitutaceae bacterium]